MKRNISEGETFIAASEIPTQGPALRFDAEGDVLEALLQAMLDEARNLVQQDPSMIFVIAATPLQSLVFTEPVPQPLIRSMMKLLGGGMLTPVKLEALNLRPLFRLDAHGFSLFVKPVLPGEEVPA